MKTKSPKAGRAMPAVPCGPPCEPLPAVEHDVEKLPDGERADGEVIAAQAKQRVGQQIGKRAGDDDGAGQRRPEIEFELLDREHAHHIGADADEAALPHGEVAHVPHEQPERDDRDHRGSCAYQQTQVVVVVDRRPKDAEKGEQDEPADHGARAAVLQKRKRRHACRSGRPNRPCGLIIRITRSTRKGTRSPSFEPT